MLHKHAQKTVAACHRMLGKRVQFSLPRSCCATPGKSLRSRLCWQLPSTPSQNHQPSLPSPLYVNHWRLSASTPKCLLIFTKKTYCLLSPCLLPCPVSNCWFPAPRPAAAPSPFSTVWKEQFSKGRQANRRLLGQLTQTTSVTRVSLTQATKYYNAQGRLILWLWWWRRFKIRTDA